MVRAARWQDAQGYQRGLVGSLLAVTILSNGIKGARGDERGENKMGEKHREETTGRKIWREKAGMPEDMMAQERKGGGQWKCTSPAGRKGRQTFMGVGNQSGLFSAGPFF